MKVFVDSENKIRAVGRTDDTSLKEVVIDDEDNPFAGWSSAKICCYVVVVSNGKVVVMTPYVDSRNLDFIDMIGKENDKLKATIEGLDGVLEDLVLNIIPIL